MYLIMYVLFCFCILLRAPICNNICLLALLTGLPSLNKDFTTYSQHTLYTVYFGVEKHIER